MRSAAEVDKILRRLRGRRAGRARSREEHFPGARRGWGRRGLAMFAESIQALQAKITTLDGEIGARAKADPIAKRLMTILGVGPVVATALVALARPATTF